MYRRILYLLSLSAIALLPALSAKAVNPHLVVMAVNSGADLVAPYDFDPPTLTSGAKGFLIGVDTGDQHPIDFLHVNPMTFSGPGLVHRQGIVNEGDPPTLAKFPRIMTRHEADAQSIVDVTNYVPEDTYLIDKQSSSMGFDPVGEQFLGGLSTDHFFTVYATPNPSGGVPMGVYPLAYVVTTGDVGISGVIGWGGLGAVGWTPIGKLSPFGGTAILEFATGTIVPEPSSLVLAALGFLGIILLAHRVTSA